MTIDVRHMEHATALAKHRSFALAARALGLSQPSLSRSIQELERRVGTKLFSRSRDGVEPSELGNIFLARAATVLAEAGELSRELSLLRGMEVGELKIGAGAYPSEMFVAQAIAALVQHRPGLKIRLVTNVAGTLVTMLRRKELDLVVADPAVATGADDLTVTPLSRHRGYAAVRAGHPLSTRRTVSLSDLVRYPLILTSQVTPDILSMLGDALRNNPKQAGDVNSIPAVGCDTPSMMRIIATGSDAVALLPWNVIQDDVASGRLVVLPYSAAWLGRAFAVVRITRRIVSPAAEAFLAELRKADLALAQREQQLSVTAVAKLRQVPPVHEPKVRIGFVASASRESKPRSLRARGRAHARA